MLKIREATLAKSSLLKYGGITFWILVDSPSITPLRAGETFNRKKGFVKAPGKSAKEVPVFGVASIFTPPQNRRKGYGGTMMRLLSKRLAVLSGGTGFPVLYSDIGLEFYANNGRWKACEAKELVIPATQVIDSKITAHKIGLEVKDSILLDVSYLKDELQRS